MSQKLKFTPCGCDLHGRFSCGDAAGPEVASKDEALAFIDRAFDRKAVSMPEATALAIAVGRTAMAADEASADLAVLRAVRDWNLQAATVLDLKSFLAAPAACPLAA